MTPSPRTGISVRAPRGRWLSAALAAAAIVAMTQQAGVAGAEDDLLPDLAMAPVEDVWVDESPAGGRFLRFAATMVNVGAGAFELRAASTAEPATEPAMSQVIYTSGGSREVAGNVRMEFAGDGHEHWHAVGVMGYELRSPQGPIRRSLKTGFCFWDGRPLAPSPEGTPTEPIYEAKSCGGVSAGSDDAATPVFMGLSPGWTDTYPSRIAWQWIDITDLPAGTYLLVLRADPAALFIERDRQNNCATVEIHLTAEAAHAGEHRASCPPVAPEIAHEPTLSEALASSCRAVDARGAFPSRPGVKAICRLVTPAAAPATHTAPHRTRTSMQSFD